MVFLYVFATSSRLPLPNYAQTAHAVLAYKLD